MSHTSPTSSGNTSHDEQQPAQATVKREHCPSPEEGTLPFTSSATSDEYYCNALSKTSDQDLGAELNHLRDLELRLMVYKVDFLTNTAGGYDKDKFGDIHQTLNDITDRIHHIRMEMCNRYPTTTFAVGFKIREITRLQNIAKAEMESYSQIVNAYGKRVLARASDLT